MKEFFKKKMSVVRFKTETTTSISKEDILEGIYTHKFAEMDGFGSNYGFTSFNDPYTQLPVFDEMSNIFGKYFAGLFRVDKINVPSSSLKKEVSEACKKEKEITGKPFISRQRKREITEGLKEYLASKAIPTINFIPFVVNMETGEGFFFNTSKSTFALFEDLFSRAYGATIEVKPLIDMYEEDLLTYIWWDSESNSFSDMQIKGEVVKTWVGNKISTVSEDQKLSASGEDIPEMKLAISNGADVDKIELWLNIGEKEAKFNLNYEGAISGLTYGPECLPDEDSNSLLPFIAWTEDVFAVIDLWEARYAEARDQGKGLTPKIRETWGRGEYCSKAFEDV